MALGIFLELPRPLAAGFLNTGILYEAAAIGLYVHIQAVGAISGSPAFQAAATEQANPGLLGIHPPPGMPFFPPTTTITNPVTVRVSLGVPMMCGSCGGSGGPVTTAGNAGTPMLVRGMNLYAPSRLVFPHSLAAGLSASPVPVPLVPDAAIDDPLRSRYLIPSTVPAGGHTLMAVNGASLVKNNFLFVTVNAATPASSLPAANN
jgi:hypothetical protein